MHVFKGVKVAYALIPTKNMVLTSVKKPSLCESSNNLIHEISWMAPQRTEVYETSEAFQMKKKMS